MAWSRDKRPFTVYMNDGEKHQIKKWVKKYPNIETGGDLFGAWIDDHTAVVQFVLGPGQNCHRTGVSFYQDIEYLRDAGGYLTQKHGLCNIGQWHSHHRLGLTRPSGGDENTVWGNMPSLGLNRYIVFIATITGVSRSYNYDYYDSSYTSSYNHKDKLTVNINPYLFEIKDGHRNCVLHGSIQEMKRNSPFRLDKAIQDTVKVGAESINKVKIFTKRPHENENENEDNPPKIMKPEEMSLGEDFDNRDSDKDQVETNDSILVDNVVAKEESGQPNTQQDGTGSNLPAEDDSKETIRFSTPTPHEEECKKKKTNIIDAERGQEQSNIAVKNEHELDNSQHYSAGEKIGNKDQVETGDTILVGDGPRDEHSEQSNIPQGDSTDNDLPAEDPNEKSNHIKTTPKFHEDHEKATENDQDSGTENDQDSSQMNSAGENFQNEQDIVETDGDTIFSNDVSRDGQSTQSNIPQGDGVESNLEGDLNEKSKSSEIQKGNEQDPFDNGKNQVQTAAEGVQDSQSGQSNVPQRDAESSLKQELDESNDHNKTTAAKTEFEEIKEKDEEKISNNTTATDNTEFEEHKGKEHEKDVDKIALNGEELVGPKSDDEKMRSEKENVQNVNECPDLIKDMEDQDRNIILDRAATDRHEIEDDDPNGTQVEGMEVDNEDLSSKSGATNAGEETVQNDPGLKGFGNLSKGEENKQDQDQDATLKALKREDDPNGTQVESMADDKNLFLKSGVTDVDQKTFEKEPTLEEFGHTDKNDIEDQDQHTIMTTLKPEKEENNKNSHSSDVVSPKSSDYEISSERNGGRNVTESFNTTATDNTEFEGYKGKKHKKDVIALNGEELVGPKSDDEKMPSEKENVQNVNECPDLIKDMEDQDRNILDRAATDRHEIEDDDPNGTQVEGMEVDNEDLSSKSGATNAGEETVQNDPGLKGENTQGQDPNGTQDESIEDDKNLSSKSGARDVDQKTIEKEPKLDDFGHIDGKDIEDKDQDTIMTTLKPDDDLSGTKVEIIKVENEHLSSNSVATNVDQEHFVKDQTLKNFYNLGKKKNDTEHQTHNAIPSALKQEGNPDGTKVERMEVDNERLPSKSGTTKVDQHTLETDPARNGDDEGRQLKTVTPLPSSTEKGYVIKEEGKSKEENKISEADKSNESERDSQQLLASCKTGELAGVCSSDKPNEQPIEKADDQKTELLKETEHLLKSIGADDENAKEINDSSNTNQEIEEPIKNTEKDLQAQSDENESKTTINGETDNNNSEFVPASKDLKDRNSDATKTVDKREDILTVDSEENKSPPLAGSMPMKIEHSSILSKQNENGCLSHENAMNGPEDQNPLEIPPKIEASMPPQKVDGNEPIKMTIDDKDPKRFTNDQKVSTKNQPVEGDAESNDSQSKHVELSKMNNSRKSRSVADTMTEADAKTHAFTAKETNKRMDSKNDETKVESDEVIKNEEVPTLEGIDQRTEDGKIINENQNKEDSSVSEKGVGKNETVDVHITQKQQKEMEQIESLASQDEAAAVNESEPQDPKGKMKVSKKKKLKRLFRRKKNKDKENKNGDNQKKKKVSGKEKMEKSKEKPESTEASKISASKEDDTMKNAASNKVKEKSKKSQKKTDAIEMLESIDGGAEDNGEQVAKKRKRKLKLPKILKFSKSKHKNKKENMDTSGLVENIEDGNKKKQKGKKSKKKNKVDSVVATKEMQSEDENTIENEEELQKKGEGKSKKSKKKNKDNKDPGLKESKDDDSNENRTVAKKGKKKKKKSKEKKQEKKPKVQEQGKKSKQENMSIETSL